MAYADDFKVYGPYTRQNGRQLVIVIDNKGIKRTISFPKWILEQQIGRPLHPDLETVDHRDSNIDNNDLSNLDIVERSEHSRQDTRRVKLIKFTCPWCGKNFERSPRLIRDKSKKNCAGPFDSRSCASSYSRALQLKLIEKFKPQEHIDSEYYKAKYTTASERINIPISFIIDYFCDIWE